MRAQPPQDDTTNPSGKGLGRLPALAAWTNASPARRIFLALLALWAAVGIGFEVWLAVTNASDGMMTDPRARWGYYDWLINYDAGFVRRGLQGEIFQNISAVIGIRPEFLVMAVLIAGYAITLGIAALLIAQIEDPSTLLALAFAPFFFMFGLLEPQGEQSKEILLMLIVAVLALRHVRGEGRADIGPEICLALLPALVLMHELFFFYSPYILIFAALQPVTRGRAIRIGLLWSLSIAAIAAAVVFHGRVEDVGPICASIARETGVAGLALTCRNDGAVMALGASASDYWTALRTDFGRLMFDSLPIVTILIALAFAPLLPLIRRAWHARRRTFWVVIGGIVIALVASAPVFILAIDWGRFLRIHAVCIGLLMIALQGRAEKEGWGQGVGLPVTGFYGYAYIGAVAIYALSWSLKHFALLVGGGLAMELVAKLV